MLFELSGRANNINQKIIIISEYIAAGMLVVNQKIVKMVKTDSAMYVKMFFSLFLYAKNPKIPTTIARIMFKKYQHQTNGNANH